MPVGVYVRSVSAQRVPSWQPHSPPRLSCGSSTAAAEVHAPDSRDGLPWTVIATALFCTGFASLFFHQLIAGDLPVWRGFASGLAAILMTRRAQAWQELWLPVVLLSLAWPWEHLLSAHLNPLLQLLTAWWAAPLTELTGLAVELQGGVDPILAVEGVRVHVTAQCAGLDPILATSSLGLIFAALASSSNRQRLLLALSIPLLAYLVNVMRIVLSVHAANLWVEQPGAWELAHDLIGYLCFGLFYGALFALARSLRTTATANNPPMM